MNRTVPEASGTTIESIDTKNISVVVYAKFAVGTAFTEEVTRNNDNIILVPYRFSYKIICNVNDELSKSRMYHGLNCTKQFLDTLDTDLTNILSRVREDITLVPLFLSNSAKDDVKMLEMKTRNKLGKAVYLQIVDPLLWETTSKQIIENLDHEIEAQGIEIPQKTVEIPSTNEIGQSKRWNEMPLVVYVKFGTVLVVAEDTITNDKIIDVPNQFSYIIKCSFNDELSELRKYKDLDCVEMFYDNLANDILKILEKTDINVPVIPVFIQKYSFYNKRFFSSALGERRDDVYILTTKDGKTVSLRFMDAQNQIKKVEQNDKLEEKIIEWHEGVEVNYFKSLAGLVVNKDRQKIMPIVVYADFETFIALEDSTAKEGIGNNIPCSYVYYIKCSNNDELSKLKTYQGDDCAANFIKTLDTDVSGILKHIDDDVSVMPIFVQNFSKYNAYFFSKLLVGSSVYGIGRTRQKHSHINLSTIIYKELLTKNKSGGAIKLRFVDTKKLFLKGHLTNFAKNMPLEKFNAGRKYWNCDRKLELMTKNGLFPYIKYQDLEQTSLPPKDQLYSTVDTYITEDEYQRAIKVWRLFKCENIRDYLQQYAIAYVLIHADLFENLRCTSIEKFDLDPAKYVDTAGFIWDMSLKTIGLYFMVAYYYFCNKGK